MCHDTTSIVCPMAPSAPSSLGMGMCCCTCSQQHAAAYLLVTVAADKTCSNAAAAAWQSASFPFSMATNAGMVPHAHASLCNAAKLACQSTQGSHSAKASRQHDIHAAMHWESSQVMTDQMWPPAQCHCPLLWNREPTQLNPAQIKQPKAVILEPTDFG